MPSHDVKAGPLRVLVAYATKAGSTAEIAGKVGEVLRNEGLLTDLVPVAEVADLAPYQAVVLGSAVYAGRWRREAAVFLERNETALSKREVWLFSSGPTGEGDPVGLMKGWRFPAELQAVADRIKVRDIALLHGKLDPAKLNILERMMIKAVKAPVGDYRDWEAILSWARGIAKTLSGNRSEQ